MLIYVTNRKLCKGNFIERIEMLAKQKPYAIMLRERNMSKYEYENLAIAVNEICIVNGVNLIINREIEIASKLKISKIHLSMNDFIENCNMLSEFSQVGVSVHSASEAVKAQELGAAYLIAGHIYATDCKKYLPPKGLKFLNDICNSVDIPVFAIGGINESKLKEVVNAGASGACIMSAAMTCEWQTKII